MSFPPHQPGAQPPGPQPPHGWTPPQPGPPQQPGPLQQPGPPQAAPGWQPGQGAPGPTGQLVLELRKPFGSLGMMSAVGKIDGHPVPVQWGHNELLVPAGTREVDIRAQYLYEFGRAAVPVTVYPGQQVVLHYSPPALTFLQGSIGPTPQPMRGKTGMIILFAVIGLILVLSIVLGIASS